MSIHFCQKHGFVPLGEQLEHCLSQNCKLGCSNLGLIPTEHPRHRKESEKEKRRKTKQVLRMVGNTDNNGNGRNTNGNGSEINTNINRNGRARKNNRIKKRAKGIR